MTLIQIEKRVRVLERTVEHLAKAGTRPSRTWYRTHAGRFADDPVFEEISKLGVAYRRTLRPAGSPRRS